MLTVLVVDDSKLSRSMAARVVQNLGHRVIEATDGSDAWKALQDDQPDLVITDLLMPGSNGFELLEQMRAASIFAPVVIVSADVQQSSRARAEQLGCLAFLRKPIKQTELSDAIQTIFSHGGVR